jgi:hypothetical protein
MKRFSWGILAGLTALAIAPQAMAATGWCQNTGNGGAPFQDSFSFIESFTNPSQNQAGMEFPVCTTGVPGELTRQNVTVIAPAG